MQRLEQLMRSAGAAKIDALALTPGTNLRHLTGMHFHHGERLMLALFTSQKRPAFVLPAMEAKRVGDQKDFPFDTYPWSDAEPAEAALAKCAGDLGLAGKTVGIEFGTMRVFELRALEGALPGCRFVDAGAVLAEQRMVKTADELRRMQEAADMIDASLEKLLPRIKPGMTERQVASTWLSEILTLGAEGAAFEFIVGSGPNSALPHHATGDRVLQKGDLLVLDGGARHHGYNSDITRTVALGEPEPELRKIYDVTLAANTAGREASRPPRRDRRTGRRRRPRRDRGRRLRPPIPPPHRPRPRPRRPRAPLHRPRPASPPPRRRGLHRRARHLPPRPRRRAHRGRRGVNGARPPFANEVPEGSGHLGGVILGGMGSPQASPWRCVDRANHPDPRAGEYASPCHPILSCWCD
jgi:Xaa-Pro dipeptidase